MQNQFLKYKFKDPTLLETALTHRSFGNFHETSNNERLEFLGDAVLQLCITSILLEHFNEKDEGDLSKFRSLLVQSRTLSRKAKQNGIDKSIRLSEGEARMGIRDSILADAFEAVCGAIYFDGGYQSAKKVLEDVFAQEIEDLKKGENIIWDYKTTLQEYTQKQFSEIPRYQVSKTEGPDHNKIYYVTVSLAEEIKESGVGKSKREAEQNAAKKALEKRGIIN